MNANKRTFITCILYAASILTVFSIAYVAISPSTTTTPKKTAQVTHSKTPYKVKRKVSASPVGKMEIKKKIKSAPPKTVLQQKPKASPKPTGKQIWLNLRSKLSHTKKQRAQLFAKHANQIRHLLRQTHRNIKVDDFTESMLGLQATFKTTNSRDKVQRYISKQYAKHVLDCDVLLKEIQNVFDSFNDECAKLDDQLLVDCQIDVSIAPHKMAACKIDWKLVRGQLERVHSKLTDELYTTVQQSLLATGVGIVAGGIGAELGKQLGRDSNGDETLASVILGFVGAIAAEQLAEEVTLDLLETRKRIRHETKNATTRLLNSLMGDGNQLGGVEHNLAQIYRNHNSLMLKTISRELKLDSNWVNKHLPK